MRVLTRVEVREAISGPDASPQLLLQRAGYAVAQFCASQFKFRSVCLVCGKGNNGGAGLAAAQALKGVAETVAVIVLAEHAEELRPELAACLSSDIEPIWISDAALFDSDVAREALGADLIVDAIIGTGFNPPLRDLAAKAVAAINDASGTVVSVDMPSGVNADSREPLHDSGGSAVFAHGIVALIAPKPAHVFGDLASGPIAVSEIGVQPALVANETGVAVITGQDVGIAFPRRPKDAHKRRFGHVLVIGGSPGAAGAAALAGLAAMSTGAGLVTIACPKSIQGAVQGFGPALMTHALPETDEGAIAIEASEHMDALLAGKDVAVLGPGLTRSGETADFAWWLLRHAQIPLVIDGDALDALQGDDVALEREGAKPFRVLALHSGQAARLAGVSIDDIQRDRLGAARRLSRETASCVVLKGWRTVVAGLSGETWINMSGNPALAKTGAGDVLAGMIGAALARQADGAAGLPEPARDGDAQFHRTLLKDLVVAAAVHLHGLAGDIARDALHENTVAATDIIEALAEAFRECEAQVEQGLFYLHK